MTAHLLILLLSSSVIQPSNQEKGVLVKTSQPQQKTIHLKGLYPAEILPLRQATIASEWSGPVLELLANEFDTVEQGQVLVRIDTEMLLLNIEEARANFEFAEKQWVRFQGLHKKNAITEQALIEVERNFKVRKITLERLEIQLRKATIRAPWSGTLLKKHVEIGDYVVPGQPLFELVDNAKLRIRGTVSGRDTASIGTGLKANLVFQNSAEVIQTQIARISPLLDSGTRSLELEALISSPPHSIRPGMVAQLEIDRKTIENTLLVPLSAILEFENGKGVYLAKDGIAVQTEVKIDGIIGKYQIIQSGLTPTDLVIIEGQTQVSDGSPIIIDEKK